MILRRVIGIFRRQEWAAMRDDRAFLTFLSGNAQRYDAYVRVHLEPWAAQFGLGFPRSGRRVV